jgi:hypothetical protein
LPIATPSPSKPFSENSLRLVDGSADLGIIAVLFKVLSCRKAFERGSALVRASVFSRKVVTMKRLLTVLALVGLLASLGLSHMMAAPPEGKKILVCHIGEIDFEPDPAGGPDVAVVTEAHVIEVSTSAETAHTDHGDFVVDDGSYAKGDDCTEDTRLDAQKKADSESDDTE